jgi:Major Facilitator Superfamily
MVSSSNRPSRALLAARRKSSTPHYQTFPTNPPKTRGRPLTGTAERSGDSSPNRDTSEGEGSHRESPLPTKQLIVLAIIALAEQTALNSISPYLPQMVQGFPEVHDGEVGLYAGIIASSYALAQFATNFYWGSLSDRIGRKPVILTGTALTAGLFVAFGFCKTLWQAIIVQALMGFVNGNAGVVSTCLGEITDKSNQSKAFVYLPIVYGIGGITGPLLGGLLVKNVSAVGQSVMSTGMSYPYLLPNLVAAAVLVADLILVMLLLEESLEQAKELPPLGKRVGELFSWIWQFTASTRPSYLRLHHHNPHGTYAQTDGAADEAGDDDATSQKSMPTFFPHIVDEQLEAKTVFTRDTILLLVTYLIFQLSNTAFNALYPIFSSSPPPTGRDLSPKEIGLSQSFAGLIMILFQVGIFSQLREKMGNRWTYRASIGLFVLAFFMVPFVGYKDDKPFFGIGGERGGKIWLWIELGIVLLIKTVASVGGLTSALLLVSVLIFLNS